uniref:Uncharacterized protein n=1 Tax=Chrysotila carterae TaxID=13221 RepID=A0A7S4FAD5_CHRCT|mmetsp:Transcript_10887/g.23222  ORF Transcript_10887/g.23222 Transcript_10887/m.23222 type:complete len:107 (-) Transcript_10887:348-668(-)
MRFCRKDQPCEDCRYARSDGLSLHPAAPTELAKQVAALTGWERGKNWPESAPDESTEKGIVKEEVCQKATRERRKHLKPKYLLGKRLIWLQHHVETQAVSWLHSCC